MLHFIPRILKKGRAVEAKGISRIEGLARPSSVELDSRRDRDTRFEGRDEHAIYRGGNERGRQHLRA